MALTDDDDDKGCRDRKEETEEVKWWRDGRDEIRMKMAMEER